MKREETKSYRAVKKCRRGWLYTSKYANLYKSIGTSKLKCSCSIENRQEKFKSRTPLGRETKSLTNAGLRQLFSNSSQNTTETQQKWSYFYKGRKNTIGKFVAWSCFSLSRGIHEKYKLRMKVASRNSTKMTLQVVFI